MPSLLGFPLGALFTSFGETVATAGGAWLYRSQARGWHPVGPETLASRSLLMLVAHMPAALDGRRRAA